LDGFAVCWGTCSQDLAAPYEPWIELCSHLVEHAPEELLAAHVERFGGELSRLARNLSRRLADVPAPQTTDPETERYLLFAAVSGFLAAVAATTPLYLVIDDAHWADRQSVALLKHVAHTVEHAPLQLLVTYRDTDLPKEHPLTAALAAVRRDDGVERIALTGLGIDEVAEMLADAAGHELDDEELRLAAEITAETGGNAFFVREILLNLSESGVVQRDEPTGHWRIDRSSGSACPRACEMSSGGVSSSSASRRATRSRWRR
jgi:predicted ATPase